LVFFSFYTEDDDPEAVRSTTRVVFLFKEGGRRLPMDVDDRQLVGDVKEKVRRALRLGSDEGLAGSESGERTVLSLSYAGVVLRSSWRFADLGIPAWAQVTSSNILLLLLLLLLLQKY